MLALLLQLEAAHIRIAELEKENKEQQDNATKDEERMADKQEQLTRIAETATAARQETNLQLQTERTQASAGFLASQLILWGPGGKWHMLNYGS